MIASEEFEPKDIHEHATLGEQILARAASSPVTHNNHVTLLYDSTENFPLWEKDIQDAQESILIEMYIFEDDEFGTKVRNFLIQKAQQGVRIILIYDWFGSIKSHYKGFFKPLIAAGAIVCPFNRISFTSGFDILARNHRKLIIIDQKIAFISGLCFSSQWEGNPNKGILPWRDTGVKLTGPVIQQAIDAFCDSLAHEQFTLPDFLTKDAPNMAPSGSVTTRLVAGKPEAGNMIRLDMFIISIAQKTLWITDAYFMATGTYSTLLKNAALDGVDVRLLVPKTSDIRWIGAVSRTQYRALLQAGVRIFEWNGQMIHAKSCVVDGYWARIGSTNLNMSSWLVNREVDITIQDRELAQQLEQKFLEDISNATEVVLNDNEFAELKENRPKKQNPVRAKTSAAARQAIRLKGFLQDDVRTIGKPEIKAVLGLSIIIMLFSILIFIFPKILVVPLSFILLVSGIILASNAINQLKGNRNPETKDIEQNKN